MPCSKSTKVNQGWKAVLSSVQTRFYDEVTVQAYAECFLLRNSFFKIADPDSVAWNGLEIFCKTTQSLKTVNLCSRNGTRKFVPPIVKNLQLAADVSTVDRRSKLEIFPPSRTATPRESQIPLQQLLPSWHACSCSSSQASGIFHGALDP